MSGVMSVCQCCGKEFVPARGAKRVARFCSMKCYQRHWYLEKTKNAKKVCPVCGKEFHPCLKFRTYCSVECMTEGNRRNRRVYRSRDYNHPGHARVELVEKVCALCGQTFTPIGQYQRYCCRKCQKTANNNMRNSRRAAARVVLTKTCAWCGQTFQTTRNDRKTCSKECSYKLCKHKCSREELEKRRVARREEAISSAAEKKLKVRVNGLTEKQMQEVVDAQDGDPSLLWKLSQNWTPAQHKYAKARYESLHGLWTQTFYC